MGVVVHYGHTDGDDWDQRNRGFQGSTMNTHGEGGVAEVKLLAQSRSPIQVRELVAE